MTWRFEINKTKLNKIVLLAMSSNGFRGRGGRGRGRGTKHFAPRGVKETLEIPRNLAGVIIGKGGENIKKYKEKSGVYNIFISDGVTPEISIVTVDAESKDICQQILTEITGLIEYSTMKTSYKSCVQATLHEFEADVEVKLVFMKSNHFPLVVHSFFRWFAGGLVGGGLAWGGGRGGFLEKYSWLSNKQGIHSYLLFFRFLL